MVKVDSKKTIRMVSGRFMKVNKGRNIIVIIAIIMTTVMFTTLFTAAASVVKSRQQHEMRNTMDSAHISVQDMTKEQFDKVRTYENIEKYGYTIFLTLAENKELNQTQTEIRYADENGAESFLSLPTKGRLPEKENEIALSTITLDQLGIPHKVGGKVTLVYTTSGKKKVGHFILSGYWKGDPLFMAQQAWISKAFCLKSSKKATEVSLEKGDYEGGYSIAIWSGNIYKLNQYAEEIETRYDLADTSARTSVNPAFEMFMGEDGFPVGSLALILGIIFLSGYLIIFNVFNISVNNDIKAYGLLKSIGATGRQLKIIVRRQALYLSVIGIPLGLVIGFFIGKAMTPFLLADIASSAVDKVNVLTVANPWIFVVSALFALCTVWIGCIKPCREAAKLSPIEAIRLSNPRLSKNVRKTRKTVSPIRMATSNVRRTWKKAVVVILSLSLPIIVLNAAYTISSSFDFDEYTDIYISSDIEVAGHTHNLQSSNLHAITPTFMAEFRQNKDITSAAYVYDTETTHHLNNKGYSNLKKIIEKRKELGYLKGYELEQELKMLESREVTTHILGINRAAFDKMTFLGKKCNWKQFQSGDYVILGSQESGLGNYYDPGDKVKLNYGDGKERERVVIAVGSAPYTMRYPFGSGTYFDYTFYVPEQEYLSVKGREGAMMVGLDVKEGADAKVNRQLTQFIEDTEHSLYINSRADIKDACSGFINKYYVTLGMLCLVLFFIGILNFFNTSAVSILTRRKELSLLEAVGMTKRQILEMLISEGVLYSIAALIIADTAGILAASSIIKRTVGKAFFFHLDATILPSIIAMPLLLAIAFAVPIYNYRKMCRETIVERIRNS